MGLEYGTIPKFVGLIEPPSERRLGGCAIIDLSKSIQIVGKASS